jgi:hypothetical protein
MNRLTARVTTHCHGRNRNSGHHVRSSGAGCDLAATWSPSADQFKIFVDKCVNNTLYLVARSGSALEMGTISDFGSKVLKSGKYSNGGKQHGHKEKGSKKEKALTSWIGSRNLFATSKDL